MAGEYQFSLIDVTKQVFELFYQHHGLSINLTNHRH